MRVGRNPLSGTRVTPYPDVVGVVITHLPDLKQDYHAQRLEVVKTCLNTMRENAGRDLAMCVWDDGSVPELLDWLKDEYRPEYLIQTPNHGKSFARTAALRMFPPETVVCVSDDDMLYYPGWLEPQLELLREFPNVGVVSGYPVRTQFRWGINSTLAWAKENAEYEWGRFIPNEWERDFCVSIGRDPEWHLNEYTTRDRDLLIRYNGLEAYGTAHHCQYIAEAGRIEFVVEWTDEALPKERFFDEAIDAQGLLRLTTTERLTRHMGNVIDADLRVEIDRMKVFA